MVECLGPVSTANNLYFFTLETIQSSFPPPPDKLIISHLSPRELVIVGL